MASTEQSVTYRVTFDRIGRTPDVAPVTFTVSSVYDIRPRIYRYALPYLRTTVAIELDLDRGCGEIVEGFDGLDLAGRFTIKRVS